MSVHNILVLFVFGYICPSWLPLVFAGLVKVYVDTIASGAVPCLENAVVAMAQIENEAAVKKGLAEYEGGMMKLKSRFPVILKEITSAHQSFNSLAIEAFMKRSFKDDDGKYMRSLEVQRT